MVYLSGAGLLGWSWKNGHSMDVVVVPVVVLNVFVAVNKIAS